MRIAGGNPLRGLTLNPWDHRRTTGGSSAGDAVAVARGLVPFGLGSDMGGSLRVPAAFAGVAAIKPTTGRVPWASSLPPEDLGLSAQLMLAAGPLARSVADLRAVLAVIAGRDPRDPCSVDAPPSPPLDEPRVALVTEPDGEPLPLATRRAIERAGEAAARAGWSVVIAEPPELARVGEVWHRLAAQDIAAMLPHVEPILSDALRDYLARFVRAARLEEVTTLRLHQERARLGRAWAGFFAEHPVTIGPAVVGPPWLVDADLDPARGVAMLEAATRFVLPANAKLYVDGRLTGGSGSERTFFTTRGHVDALSWAEVCAMIDWARLAGGQLLVCAARSSLSHRGRVHADRRRGEPPHGALVQPGVRRFEHGARRNRHRP